MEEYIRLAYHGQRVKAPGFNCLLMTNFDPHVNQVLIIPQQIGQVVRTMSRKMLYRKVYALLAIPPHDLIRQ